MDSILFASDRHDWQTPDEVLIPTRRLGPIVLDPCTDETNPCEATYPLTQRGLEADWRTFGTGGIVYVNPPYGRQLGEWVSKCIVESLRDLEIVLLTPARPDTDWYDRARTSCKAWCEIRGRLTFKGAPSTAPFPSAIHYWGPRPFLFCHEFQSLGRVGLGGRVC
jgi:hypothetical protein